VQPKLVFSDFDGTLTLGESLTPDFFTILNLLEQKKIPLIVVTGRSVQWSYFTMTHFSSLMLSIAEGGGVWVERQGHQIQTHLVISLDEQEKLRRVAFDITQKFKLSLSADSSGRLTDRAIELYDLASSTNLKKEVEHYLDEQDVHHSTSSVHLNFWVGSFTKASTMKLVLNQFYPDVGLNELVYFGDSLNDESVFEQFPRTIGVKNIEKVWDRLKYKPKQVTADPGPQGVLSALIQELK
jgi:HAD superfamily hydrolase (TIGR01484 family)